MEITRYWKLDFWVDGTPHIWITKTSDALLKHAVDDNPDILFLGGHHKLLEYTEDEMHWILAGGIFKAHILYDSSLSGHRNFHMTELGHCDESTLKEMTRLGNRFAFQIWTPLV